MSAVAFPIFVAEGLDIGIFETVEDAERSLEPWWVEEGLGRVYDAQGRLLVLKVKGKRVSIQSSELEPSHVEEMKSLLREYLKVRSAPEGNDQNCDLPCLVEVCRKYIK